MSLKPKGAEDGRLWNYSEFGSMRRRRREIERGYRSGEGHQRHDGAAEVDDTHSSSYPSFLLPFIFLPNRLAGSLPNGLPLWVDKPTSLYFLFLTGNKQLSLKNLGGECSIRINLSSVMTSSLHFTLLDDKLYFDSFG